MRRKVIDENGRVYAHLREAFDENGIPRPNGAVYRTFDLGGQVRAHGITFSVYDGKQPNAQAKPGQTPRPVQPDPLMTKLKERYTEDELKAIAQGEGIAKRYIPFPDIHLEGTHHRILVMSDTHIGSVYSPEEWHGVVAGYANDPENGIECILHCGDLVDGLKIGRAGTQIYELSEIGYEAQRNKAVELMSLYRPPIYIISGNHDAYFREFAGANLVKDVCNRVGGMTYIGHDTADIDVGGCTVRLFHGGDGNSYALSYRLQKLVEAITEGRKPHILLAGHVHKYCVIFDRGIHAISVPAMQSQTSYMRAKKLASHTGFLVLEFDSLEGNIRNLSVKYFPFYA